MPSKRPRRPWLCCAALLALLGAFACDPEPRMPTDAGEPDAGPEPAFPEDFESSYLEMRDCRHSHEHELRYIRVFASESAQAPYAALSQTTPYPVGATLVKLEYEDALCTTLIEYTALRKLAPGSNPAGGDWVWQRVSSAREVLENGAPWRCINCHNVHCAPPLGYDLTCAEEL